MKETVLSAAKHARGGNTTQKIKQMGANIFPQKEFSIDRVVEDALAQGLIELNSWDGSGRRFQISPDGILSLTVFWTNHFCEEYKELYQDVMQMFEEAQLQPLDKVAIMRLYHAGESKDSIYKKYIHRHEIDQYHAESYHRHLIKEYANIPEIKETDYVFHFAPRFFTPSHLIGEKVELEINGVKSPPNLIISSPYTNKRYYAAGLKKGRIKSCFGMYPIVAAKEDFPESIDISLRWLVESDFKLDHHIKINFDFRDTKGQLFSSDQKVVHNMKNNGFHLTSFTNQDSYIKGNREAKVIIHDIIDHYEIREEATLSNIPMNLHSTMWAGNHFDKWYGIRG
ncbi:MAG: hypothetical protein ACQEXV_22450 [Bacillota bacterium]